MGLMVWVVASFPKQGPVVVKFHGAFNDPFEAQKCWCEAKRNYPNHVVFKQPADLYQNWS